MGQHFRGKILLRCERGYVEGRLASHRRRLSSGCFARAGCLWRWRRSKRCSRCWPRCQCWPNGRRLAVCACGRWLCHEDVRKRQNVSCGRSREIVRCSIVRVPRRGRRCRGCGGKPWRVSRGPVTCRRGSGGVRQRRASRRRGRRWRQRTRGADSRRRKCGQGRSGQAPRGCIHCPLQARSVEVDGGRDLHAFRTTSRGEDDGVLPELRADRA